MPYQTVITDLKGVFISELAGATQRRFATPVCSMATASAQVRIDHDDADALLDCKTLLKVYETLTDDEATRAAAAGATVLGDGRLLHFVGRQVTGEEAATAGSTGSIAATWADPFWTLMRRLCGKSQTGYSNGTAVSLVDPGTVIIMDLVANQIAGFGAEAGVLPGVLETSTPTFVTGWYYKPIGEAIAELCASLFGPDWRIRPIEPIPNVYAVATHGMLDVKAVIGQSRPDAIYEYGDGLLNVSAYRRGVTMEGVATRAYHLPPGFPDNAVQAVMQEDDTTGAADTYGVLEAVINGDISADDLRRKLLRQHIAIRANPRQTITFDPVRDLTGNRVPRLGIDVNPGDVGTFRASIRRRDGVLAKRINATMRLYQFAVNIDDQGHATTSLTVAPG